MTDMADLMPTLTPFFENRGMLLERMLAAVTAASKMPGADISRFGAIGYCFGGTGGLDLARAGGDPIKKMTMKA